MELLILCHVFPQGREHSNPLPTQRPSAPKVLSAQRTSSLRYFSSRCTLSTPTSRRLENSRAPEEDVLVQDQLDGWEDVEGISKACPMFLKIIRIELTSHFGIEKSSRARCQEILRRPAVAPDTYSSSEGHQLRFDSRHRRSAYKNDTLQAGADND